MQNVFCERTATTNQYYLLIYKESEDAFPLKSGQCKVGKNNNNKKRKNKNNDDIAA